VNKFIRERIGKEEKRVQKEQEAAPAEKADENREDESLIGLVSSDEKSERSMVRNLLDYGRLPWDESMTVADYLFHEIEENGLADMIDNRDLMRIVETYRKRYAEGAEPSLKDFLYHEDAAISRIAVSLSETPPEISPRWKDFYDGPLPTVEDLYKQEVFSSLTYLKLRKIKRMIVENQQDIERNPNSPDLMLLLNTHQHLKNLEVELTRSIGTVILK
jgi:DNA primase